MSFGFSIGDFITVPTFAWQIYKSCKDSSDDFKNISGDVASMHIVLKEIADHLSEQPLEAERRKQLQILGKGCCDVLKDLEALLAKYESLGTQSQRAWDRMRWGTEDISSLRERLVCSTAMLTAFNTAITSSSQARVLKKLEKLLAEIRAGKREGSIVSIQTIESLSTDDRDAWRQLRKELEDVDISTTLFLQHRRFIVAWFRLAIETGAFEEGAVTTLYPAKTVDLKHSLADNQGGAPPAGNPQKSSLSIVKDPADATLAKRRNVIGRAMKRLNTRGSKDIMLDKVLSVSPTNRDGRNEVLVGGGQRAIDAPIVPSVLRQGTTLTKITKKKRKTLNFVLDPDIAKVSWDRTNSSKELYIDDIQQIYLQSDAKIYHEELHIPPNIESLWFTIVYADQDRATGRHLKTMHLIAPNQHLFELWTSTLNDLSRYRRKLKAGPARSGQDRRTLLGEITEATFEGRFNTASKESLYIDPSIEQFPRAMRRFSPIKDTFLKKAGIRSPAKLPLVPLPGSEQDARTALSSRDPNRNLQGSSSGWPLTTQSFSNTSNFQRRHHSETVPHKDTHNTHEMIIRQYSSCGSIEGPQETMQQPRQAIDTRTKRTSYRAHLSTKALPVPKETEEEEIVDELEDPSPAYLPPSNGKDVTSAVVDREFSVVEAEQCLLSIMRALDNLQDLLSIASVSKGFYRTYKRHQLPLIKNTIWKCSPAAWELREISPVHAGKDERSISASDLSPNLYLQHYKRDLFTLTTLKTLILTHCESVLYAEFGQAIAGRTELSSTRVDDAFWRIFTFCQLFGCEQNLKDEVEHQEAWLNGGLEETQSCMINQPSVLESCEVYVRPAGFAKGNGSGLTTEQLKQMTEIWTCLIILHERHPLTQEALGSAALHHAIEVNHSSILRFFLQHYFRRKSDEVDESVASSSIISSHDATESTISFDEGIPALTSASTMNTVISQGKSPLTPSKKSMEWGWPLKQSSGPPQALPSLYDRPLIELEDFGTSLLADLDASSKYAGVASEVDTFNTMSMAD